MSRVALLLARFAASAWVGAAVLFVATSVRQTTSRLFESVVTDQMVLLRFPLYYIGGFSLVGLALAGTTAAGRRLSSRVRGTTLGLLGLALVLMLFDYMVIYSPLAVMINPPGQARPQGFMALHRWSMIVNLVDLLLITLAALILCGADGSTSAPERESGQ